MRSVFKKLLLVMVVSVPVVLAATSFRDASAEFVDTDVVTQKNWRNEYEQGANKSTLSHAKLTSDGGYVVAGSTCTQRYSGCDGVVVKYSSNDQIEWQLVWGGTGNEILRDVVEVEDGGNKYYIAAGRFENPVTAGGTTITSAGGTDVALVKIDSDGQIVWQKVGVEMEAKMLALLFSPTIMGL